MRALLLAACLGAPDPRGLGHLSLGPATPTQITIEDENGEVIATAAVRDDASTVVHVPPGAYVVRGAGTTRSVDVRAGETAAPDLPGQVAPDAVEAGTTADAGHPVSRPQPPPPKPAEGAWRAPLLSTFVPGLGHAWAGKPLWGVGILATMAGAVTSAVVLGRSLDETDGATPSDAGRSPGYARLGGFVALTSLAGALYIGQIFDAHRVERGEALRPVAGRVQLRFDRLTAVSMAPGRPRAAIYDDFSLAALVRVSPRVRVGPSDASVKLGPEQTVLQLGARATAQVFGPTAEHPLRRFSFTAGGGVLGQLATRRRTVHPLDPTQDADVRTQRGGGAVPYVLADARLFVAPRWSVGALGRLGVPLTPRRYAGGRALPAYAATVELGVSLGVNL